MKNILSMLAFVAALSLLVSCNQTTQQSERIATHSEKLDFYVDTLTTALKNPWGMVFLPDGRMLVNDRIGEIRILKEGKLLDEKVQGVPKVLARGQGGLLDIQLHPDYASNGWIYLSYSKPVETDTTATTVIARAKLEGNNLVQLEELFQAAHVARTYHHYGSRIVFDGKGYMFFSSGERGTKENAQMLDNHLGKILRLQDDGKVPTDNPFVGNTKAMPEIWSYGHRNPQGLYYDKATDILWEHEHGPKGGDELNIIEKGKNYGWPVITYGINYDGTVITTDTTKEGMEQPVHFWLPSIGACGMELVTSDKYPNWKGNFLVGSMAFQFLSRVEMDGKKFVKEEKLMEKVGRVRTIRQGTDGYLYIATELPGKILRLMPKE